MSHPLSGLRVRTLTINSDDVEKGYDVGGVGSNDVGWVGVMTYEGLRVLHSNYFDTYTLVIHCLACVRTRTINCDES